MSRARATLRCARWLPTHANSKSKSGTHHVNIISLAPTDGHAVDNCAAQGRARDVSVRTTVSSHRCVNDVSAKTKRCAI
eukprot:4684632-Pyramimonas_sp.AAC.1